jgi:hypothetical protein
MLYVVRKPLISPILPSVLHIDSFRSNCHIGHVFNCYSTVYIKLIDKHKIIKITAASFVRCLYLEGMRLKCRNDMIFICLNVKAYDKLDSRRAVFTCNFNQYVLNFVHFGKQQAYYYLKHHFFQLTILLHH